MASNTTTQVAEILNNVANAEEIAAELAPVFIAWYNKIKQNSTTLRPLADVVAETTANDATVIENADKEISGN